MKRLASLFVVVSQALAGCGGAVCEALSDANKALIEKRTPCDDDTSAGDDYFSVSTCNKSLGKCTDEEKDALSNYASCVSQLGMCSASNPEDFDSAVLDCAFSAADTLSAGCSDAVFGASLRPPAASDSIGR